MVTPVLLLLVNIGIAIVIIILVVLERSNVKKLKAAQAAQVSPLEKAQAKADGEFESQAAVQAEQLQKSIERSSARIEKNFTTSMEALSAKYAKSYEQALKSVQDQALRNLTDITKTSTVEERDMQKQIAAATKEKKDLINKKIDSQLAELLVSYLAEVAPTLDYQQQKDYLFAQLEAQKDQIKKDVERGL